MSKKINVYTKKSFIQSVKDGYKYANAQLNMHPEELVKIVDNVYAYTNTEKSADYLQGKGIVLAAITSARDIFGNIFHVVLTDTSFENLPNFVQQFLIHHEVGHALNGDLNGMTEISSTMLLIKRAFGFLPEMEVKADAYAAKINGIEETKKAIKFLICNTNVPLRTKIELLRRYKKVQYAFE